MLVLITRFLRLAVVTALLGLCGCATIDDILSSSSSVDYKKGYDFDGIRTVSVACVMDPESDDAPMGPEDIERMDGALVRAIERKGLTVVDDPAAADAHVSWHVVAEEQSSLRGYNASANYQCWRCGPAISSTDVVTYTEGTFIVDIIDPALNQSVWRGIMKGRMAADGSTDMRDERLDQAAREMFAKFPPGFLIDGIY